MKTILISALTIVGSLVLGWLFLKGLSNNQNESALNLHSSFFKKAEIEMTQKDYREEKSNSETLDYLENWNKMKKEGYPKG